MDTIFTVRNEDLERLSPEEAVGFFRELLWAEATTSDIGKDLINVPSAITVADGGIDAEVQDIQVQGGQGLIKQGLTRYQIKTGSFNLSKDSYIKDILFKESSNDLKPRVKSCLDKNGTLVIVLFGWDNPETKDDQLVNKFREKLVNVDQQYESAKIKIWRQNNLISFLKPFPSLALRANRRAQMIFQTHRSWSQEAEMRRVFKAGQEQKEFILNMQSELCKNNKAIHIRVWGEPGIGKTRLVLETTRKDDLSPLVIYCDAASKFRDSDLMNEILRDDNQFSTILAIDECDPDSRSYIWNKLKYCGRRIKFVSIYNDYDETSGNINYLNAPPLDEEQVSSIIQEYGIPKDQADRWPEFCGGSPRVAHVLGQNLKYNQEDLLKSPDTVNVWGRYIVGSDDPNSQAIQQRRLVLQYIALFKRFGYGRPVIAEAQAIAKIVEQEDPQLTWPRFTKIIQNLKALKILHGENTLYITPKALHIKLWSEWWDTYGQRFSFEDFSKALPVSLRDWFYEMFKYAAESDVATRIVKDLLGENGPIQKSNYLKTVNGANFFLALTEADPEEALRCLKKTVGTWSEEELKQFTTGRSQVVWALEKIAMWRTLFPDAARLLLALEAENEKLSNTSSSIFAKLFSPAPGFPPEASPQQRLPVLEEALQSSSERRRILALQACDQALESQHFFRVVGPERQGLKREPKWIPKTYGELFDAYRQVWQLLYEQLDSLSEDEQQQAINILLMRARGLGNIHDLADMVIDKLDELTEKTYVDKKDILAKVVQITHYDGKRLPLQTRQRWEQLRDRLTGSDFPSLMMRYVGMALFEDKFDDEGNQVDQTKPRIEELAKLVIKNNDLLLPELDWLVTSKAQNGFEFGFELGKSDKDFGLLPTLLEAQQGAGENGSAYFLGGYFRALFEKDQPKWEGQLDALTEDTKLNVLVPELTWRSGVTDQAALRILSLAESGIIDISQFRMFGMGSVIEDLSEGIFERWIKFLLESSNTYAAYIALDLYYFYYIHKDSKITLPEELTFQLLTHHMLFQKPEIIGIPNQMDEYHWTEIGKAFVRFYPERSLQIADKMLQHFGESGTIVGGYQ